MKEYAACEMFVCYIDDLETVKKFLFWISHNYLTGWFDHGYCQLQRLANNENPDEPVINDLVINWQCSRGWQIKFVCDNTKTSKKILGDWLRDKQDIMVKQFRIMTEVQMKDFIDWRCKAVSDSIKGA